MVNEESPSIKSDRKVKNLKVFIANFKSGGSKKLRLPSKVWKKVAELAGRVSPLSNDECERMIKLIITHRKNSMF